MERRLAMALAASVLSASCEPGGPGVQAPDGHVASAAVAGQLVKRIRNPSPANGDGFGSLVTKVGSNFVISAPLDNVAGNIDAGSVYLYDGTDRSLLATVPNPSPSGALGGDRFGETVTAVGTNFVVGAPKDNSGGFPESGSVYLYNGATGALIASIPNPTPAIGERFGTTVAAVGANFVVGVPTDNGGAGTAFLYDGSTGALIVGGITCATCGVGDQFGDLIVAVGSNFVVGAVADDLGADTDAGSVSLYNGSSGALIQFIPNPKPAAGENFGQVVTTAGGNFVVSAPGEGTAATRAGAVYLYNGSTGALILEIPNPAPAAFDEFGTHLMDLGSGFLVSAPDDDPGGVASAGSVYLFDAAGVLQETIPNPFPNTSDQFGKALAALPGVLVVGVPDDDVNSVPQSGSVYLFSQGTGLLGADIPNPSPGSGEGFGTAITTVNTVRFVVHAPNDVEGGSVYLYAPGGSLVAAIHNPSPATSSNFGAVVCDLGSTFVVGNPSEGAGVAYVYAASSTPNVAPVAANDSGTIAEDETLSIPIATLLANDDDLDGDPLTVTQVSAASGSASISGSVVNFTPPANFSGATSLTYTISDPAGLSDTATVAVTVTAVNDAPVAEAVTVSTLEDTPVTAAGVASDVEGSSLTYSTVFSPAGVGTFSTWSTGAVLTYSPLANFTGTATLSYQVSDGTTLSAPASLTFIVIPVNDPPGLVGISAPADGSVVASSTPTLVVANATDVDSPSLSYHFQVSDAPTFAGAQTTTVVAGTNGTTSLVLGPLTDDATYYWRARAFDGTETSDWMAASFHVNAANAAPTAPIAVTPVNVLIPEGTAPVLAVQNATDADGDALTYEFEVTDAAGAIVATGSAVPEGAGGLTSYAVTTTLEGGVHTWRARASDGTAGPWSAEATFEVNEDETGGGCGCTVENRRPMGGLPALLLFLAALLASRRARAAHRST